MAPSTIRPLRHFAKYAKIGVSSGYCNRINLSRTDPEAIRRCRGILAQFLSSSFEASAGAGLDCGDRVPVVSWVDRPLLRRSAWLLAGAEVIFVDPRGVLSLEKETTSVCTGMFAVDALEDLGFAILHTQVQKK